jgi:hypothetical protein
MKKYFLKKLKIVFFAFFEEFLKILNFFNKIIWPSSTNNFLFTQFLKRNFLSLPFAFFPFHPPPAFEQKILRLRGFF